jgi:hypothetical protein
MDGKLSRSGHDDKDELPTPIVSPDQVEEIAMSRKRLEILIFPDVEVIHFC